MNGSRLNPGDHVAVLTGDIVGLGKGGFGNEQTVRRRLEGIHEELNDSDIRVPYPMDVARTGRWQLVVRHPAKSLRVALYVRAVLRSLDPGKRFDACISIGEGSIEFLPEQGAASGGGSAYQDSRAGLDGMKRSRRLAFSGPEDAELGLLTDACDSIAGAVDHAASWWTAPQAFAVSQSLLGRTQREIGESWTGRPITQQAVGQHLQRGGWSAVEAALGFFERRLVHEPET